MTRFDKNKTIYNAARNSLWIIVFLVIYALSMAYANRVDITANYYDSALYWNLANDIFYNGYNPIYIFRYPQSVRGYFFPVLVGYFKAYFNGVTGWRILASLSMAACFSLSLPYAINRKRIQSLRELFATLLAYGVYMWVWGDFMQYPLSDFISCFLLISALAFLRWSEHTDKIILQVLFAFFAGVFLYAAYNTRTTYLYSGIIVLLVYFLHNRKNLKRLLVGLMAMVIGMAVIAFPQCHINNRIEGCFTPKVYYEMVDGEIYKGIYTARYETYIGDREDYPHSGVVFRDAAGYEIIQRENLTMKDFKLSDIFEIFLKYPLDMLGIYGRHFISLMTPVYRQAYITDIYHPEPFLIIISIFLWLIAGFGLFVQIKSEGLNRNALLILAICIPSLLQIFDEPELRFFLPLYLLCYYYAFTMINYKKFFSALKANWFPVLAISILIFGIWIAMTDEILSGNEDIHLLLSNNIWFYQK